MEKRNVVEAQRTPGFDTVAQDFIKEAVAGFKDIIEKKGTSSIKPTIEVPPDVVTVN